MMDAFGKMSVTIMANTCGPCIGQWKCHVGDPIRKNSIVALFNRNLAKRVDGNSNTFAFVASPEIALALTIAGDFCFNSSKDRLVNRDGERMEPSEPTGNEPPSVGLVIGNQGY